MVYFVTMVNLMGYGWGKHLWDVSRADLANFNKILLPNTLSYLMCPSMTKMAMLSILYRINPFTIYRTVVVCAAVAIFAYTLVLCLITGLPCNPLVSGTSKCLQNVALAHAVLNIASDFAVLAVPVPTLYSLQLTPRQKVSVGCVLAIGSGVVICSIARLPYAIILPSTADVTYTNAVLGVWSIIEVNLGILCVCTMRLWPLIVTYLPRLRLFSSESGGTGKVDNGLWGKGLHIRDDKAQHTYELHSVQKGNDDPLYDREHIHIHRSYKVDVEGTVRDGGSTDQILA